MNTPDLKKAAPPHLPGVWCDQLQQRRCTATAKTTGERCKRRPIPGGAVCKLHGGGSPQAKRTARQRLQALVEPAIEALNAALACGDIKEMRQAARVVLDRTGFGPSSSVEMSGPDGRPMQVENLVPLDRLSLETRRAIVADLRKAQGGNGSPALPPATGGGSPPSGAGGVNPPGGGLGSSSPAPPPGGGGSAPPNVSPQPLPTVSPFADPSDPSTDSMIL